MDNDKPMQLPRVCPLKIEDMDQHQRELLGLETSPGVHHKEVNLLFRTVIRHPEAFVTWRTLARFVNTSTQLPARDRELMIHRLCWLMQAEWEWGKHRQRALQAGLTLDDIERAKVGPEAEGWTPWDQALLRAVDGLHMRGKIPDEAWQELSHRYDERQMIELILHTGHYQIANMMTNSLGVPNEPNLEGF